MGYQWRQLHQRHRYRSTDLSKLDAQRIRKALDRMLLAQWPCRGMAWSDRTLPTLIRAAPSVTTRPRKYRTAAREPCTTPQ
jgi:hypothetical protein